MTRPEQHTPSRSLRVYARLLNLYPPAFLQQHRDEMLQNFADLEEAATSKAALWLLIGKDLTMSLVSQFFASQLGGYVIAVLVTWMLIFVIGYFTHGSTAGYPALHAFGGFLPGMLFMYIAMRLATRASFSSRSGISATPTRPAIRCCRSPEVSCSACCRCPSRRMSTECREAAHTLSDESYFGSRLTTVIRHRMLGQSLT